MKKMALTMVVAVSLTLALAGCSSGGAESGGSSSGSSAAAESTQTSSAELPEASFGWSYSDQDVEYALEISDITSEEKVAVVIPGTASSPGHAVPYYDYMMQNKAVFVFFYSKLDSADVPANAELADLPGHLRPHLTSNLNNLIPSIYIDSATVDSQGTVDVNGMQMLRVRGALVSTSTVEGVTEKRVSYTGYYALLGDSVFALWLSEDALEGQGTLSEADLDGIADTILADFRILD